MGKISHKNNDKIRPEMDLEWTFPYLEDAFQGYNFGPKPLVIAICHGDATFGRIFACMFQNQESETVSSHILKFFEKVLPANWRYFGLVSIYGVIFPISPI